LLEISVNFYLSIGNVLNNELASNMCIIISNQVTWNVYKPLYIVNTHIHTMIFDSTAIQIVSVLWLHPVSCPGEYIKKWRILGYVFNECQNRHCSLDTKDYKRLYFYLHYLKWEYITQTVKKIYFNLFQLLIRAHKGTLFLCSRPTYNQYLWWYPTPICVLCTSLFNACVLRTAILGLAYCLTTKTTCYTVSTAYSLTPPPRKLHNSSTRLWSREEWSDRG